MSQKNDWSLGRGKILPVMPENFQFVAEFACALQKNLELVNDIQEDWPL